MSTDPGRVLFSEWAPHTAPRVDAAPGPCSICGTRLGACTHDVGREVQIIRTALRNVQERITHNE